MDCVPFAFCQSVCALFDFTLLNLGSHAWIEAGERSWDSRVFFSIGYSNGAWSYNLQLLSFPWTGFREITLEEMKRINRRHLQIVKVSIDLVHFLTIYPHTATLGEIFEILNFAFTVLNKALLTIKLFSDFPEDLLSLLLTRFRNVPFHALEFYDSPLIKDFLRIQLQSNDALVSIALDSGGFEEFHAEVEEFANRSFDSIRVTFSSMVFDKTFFEALFSKPLGERQGVRRFSAHFSFSDEELKAFRSEDQEEHNDKRRIVWKRKDGVRVTVIKFSPYRQGAWQIIFTRSQT